MGTTAATSRPRRVMTVTSSRTARSTTSARWSRISRTEAVLSMYLMYQAYTSLPVNARWQQPVAPAGLRQSLQPVPAVVVGRQAVVAQVRLAQGQSWLRSRCGKDRASAAAPPTAPQLSCPAVTGTGAGRSSGLCAVDVAAVPDGMDLHDPLGFVDPVGDAVSAPPGRRDSHRTVHRAACPPGRGWWRSRAGWSPWPRLPPPAVGPRAGCSEPAGSRAPHTGPARPRLRALSASGSRLRRRSSSATTSPAEKVSPAAKSSRDWRRSASASSSLPAHRRVPTKVNAARRDLAGPGLSSGTPQVDQDRWLRQRDRQSPRIGANPRAARGSRAARTALRTPHRAQDSSRRCAGPGERGAAGSVRSPQS